MTTDQSYNLSSWENNGGDLTTSEVQAQKGKKVMRNNHDELTKGKSYPNLTMLTVSVVKNRGDVNLNLSKTFNKVCRDTLTSN